MLKAITIGCGLKRFKPGKRFLALLLIHMGLIAPIYAAGPVTRLAIGTFGLAPETRDGELADLVAVHLSTEPKFDLVERRELNTALKEAELSASGNVRAKDAVQLGKLIRADEFLLGTSVAIDNTNYLFVRLVDARNGVIRAINVFQDTGSVEALADKMADFASRENKGHFEERKNYLAIGVIQNLGVNNRFSAFPAEMRGSVTARLDGKATVLERDVVSFLANEVQLDMAGLTDTAGKPAAQMQFGFWIVDGFYQSYEVSNAVVQLKLRVERVQGKQQVFDLQGKPDELFFSKIGETITDALKQPAVTAAAPTPTRADEIAALEARGNRLLTYEGGEYGAMVDLIDLPLIRINAGRNADQFMNTLEEATRIYRSILLLDPDNNAAKMRLACCLLFDTESYVGVQRAHEAERMASANEYFREIIATADPGYANDARLELAVSIGGLDGVALLRQFTGEATDLAAKIRFQRNSHFLLEKQEYKLPIDVVMPELRLRMMDELNDLKNNPEDLAPIGFENVLSAYRFYNSDHREEIVNQLLPEMLKTFPELKPYILRAAAAEQSSTNSPVIQEFLATLKDCEEHPESVWNAPVFFGTLAFDLNSEEDLRNHHTDTPFKRTFDNGQYATIIAEAKGREAAAQRGQSMPLTNAGKRLLAESYAGLGQWQDALKVFEELPEGTPQEKNECRQHLGLALESEEVPDTAWDNTNDQAKVQIAYDCMGHEQWATAAKILESIGHRTVEMSAEGPWGWPFTPVLPAVVAADCRVKAGLPVLHDPMRFEIGEQPYVYFANNRPIAFAFQVEGEDLWLATYSQIKRYQGDGPFVATAAAELHNFERTTRTKSTAICVSENYIWVGTWDDGLIEFDRRTGTSRQLTINDGLVLNGISGLMLRGRNLWIAYNNKGNGAVGTLNIDSHKLSSFTPDLPANAADPDSSVEAYRTKRLHQPPVWPIDGMDTDKAGDLWFLVAGKGLQRYRTLDNRWDTLVQSTVATTFRDLAVAPALDEVLLAERDDMVAFNGGKSTTGGLLIYDYDQNKTNLFQIYQGLPSNDITTVAVDGRIAWVGGLGFVAVVDLAKQKVLRIAYIPATVQGIQLSPLHAWVAIACKKRGDPDYAGDANNGVYRLDRAGIEVFERDLTANKTGPAFAASEQH